MASIIISAVANVFEVRGLKKAWGRRHLKVSAAVKLAVVTFCFCAGITMVGLMSSCGTASGQPLSPHCNTIESAAAVLEWTIAFLITVYFLSFVADLWPVAEVGVEAVQEMVSAPRETNVGARNAMEPLSSVVAIDGQSPPPRYFDGRLGGNFSAENGTREPYEDIPFNDPYPVARGA